MFQFDIRVQEKDNKVEDNDKSDESQEVST